MQGIYYCSLNILLVNILREWGERGFFLFSEPNTLAHQSICGLALYLCPLSAFTMKTNNVHTSIYQISLAFKWEGRAQEAQKRCSCCFNTKMIIYLGDVGLFTIQAAKLFVRLEWKFSVQNEGVSRPQGKRRTNPQCAEMLFSNPEKIMESVRNVPLLMSDKKSKWLSREVHLKLSEAFCFRYSVSLQF